MLEVNRWLHTPNSSLWSILGTAQCDHIRHLRLLMHLGRLFDLDSHRLGRRVVLIKNYTTIDFVLNLI